MAGAVWVVIVNYRTAGLAIDCLRSIAAHVSVLPRLQALLVDNASGDGSAQTIRAAIAGEGWDSWASVLALDRNGGFAFGCNAGIRQALRHGRSARYVMLLNPDAAVRERTIAALAEFMDAHPLAGIAGSRIENPQGAVEASAHNRFSPLGELLSGARLGMLSRALPRYDVTPSMRHTAHECDWVSGASLMIRREVLEQIGELDEGYFLYFEEADYCLRAKKAGWQVWYVPESRVLHLEGASTGIRETARRRPRYWYDSRRRYFVKHFGVSGLVLADTLWAGGRVSLALRRMLRLGSGGKEREPSRFAFDLLWGDLRALLTRSHEF
jgi:N-acetylglucosaminyl-diphospho-decaprenol L-rhamnosyltransferase